MLPRLLSSRRFKFHGYRIFSTLITRSHVPPEILNANKKITALIRSDRLDEARAFFDGLWQRNTVTWNSMLSGYVKRREIAKARWLFDEMPEVDDAFTLFNAMHEKNVVTWNAIITGLLDNGRVKTACELFRVMPERDAASLSAMVSGLIQNDKLDEAGTLLLEYRELGEGVDDLIHAYNTLIAGYGQKGRVRDARRLFDKIPLCSDDGSGRKSRFERNVVSWNSMIMAYVKVRVMDSASDMFNEMESQDIVTWNTMISGYVNASDMETATKLFFDMKTPDVLSWNSIISGYARAGKMKLALGFFQKMPQKNQVSWNTMIAGYEKNGGIKEAVELFLCMQAEGEKLDRHTLSSLLSICAECAAQLTGMQVHQLVTKIVIPDNPLYNSLIRMYAKCGAISEARTVFDETKTQKNVISWNAMIGGYASHGFAREALELFESMKCFKMKPTYITFISVLSVCAHGGLVEEGRSYFKSMAMDIINSMPVEPDKAVWGALMGACRMLNNVELARIAAQALMKLEPESSGPYVLQYSMFADAERWNEADEIRIVMEKNNIKKSRGYSRVESIYLSVNCHPFPSIAEPVLVAIACTALIAGFFSKVSRSRILFQSHQTARNRGVPASYRKMGHDFVVEVENAGKLRKMAAEKGVRDVKEIEHVRGVHRFRLGEAIPDLSIVDAQ
ncbi:hypothetical protein SASPL_107142 [Salvia splendens]|uniref:Pentatricopeptide repeat-containing protein n=1 Tax=Salvia splendens TaxID=180675 RepID=A0A8X9A5G2_SALSN|nr:hypothetical protein SASPL_107142 [Salvia splendens]